MLPILLSFLENYCNEAIDAPVYISKDIPPSSIVTTVFKDRESLEYLYEEGKAKRDASNRVQLYYDMINFKWTYKKPDLAVSLLHMGILLEDWDFVNSYNPYERNN